MKYVCVCVHLCANGFGRILQIQSAFQINSSSNLFENINRKIGTWTKPITSHLITVNPWLKWLDRNRLTFEKKSKENSFIHIHWRISLYLQHTNRIIWNIITFIDISKPIKWNHFQSRWITTFTTTTLKPQNWIVSGPPSKVLFAPFMGLSRSLFFFILSLCF